MPTPSIHAFAEKVAVITDGSNPIGRAVALQLALQGSYVIVASPDADSSDASALDELKSLGTLASVVHADVFKPEGAAALVEAAAGSFGRIDLLVNVFNERTGQVAEGAERMIDGALELLNSRPKPKVVTVVGNSESEVPKVSAVTERYAADMPPKFRINAVVAGERFGEAAADLDPELFPARNGIDPDDVARVVVFLLSAESIGVNGRIIHVGR